MIEACMGRPWVYQMRKAELANVPKSLEGCGVDDFHRGGVDSDGVPHGIANHPPFVVIIHMRKLGREGSATMREWDNLASALSSTLSGVPETTVYTSRRKSEGGTGVLGVT